MNSKHKGFNYIISKLSVSYIPPLIKIYLVKTLVLQLLAINIISGLLRKVKLDKLI